MALCRLVVNKVFPEEMLRVSLGGLGTRQMKMGQGWRKLEKGHSGRGSREHSGLSCAIGPFSADSFLNGSPEAATVTASQIVYPWGPGEHLYVADRLSVLEAL